MRRTEHVLASGETGPIGVIAAGLPETEAAAVRVAGDLALETDAHVYVVHLSSAEGLAQVGAARERGARVLAETCPQYLFLTDDALRQPAETAQDFLCTPPVRTDADRCSLWEGLAVGDLDAVATDHCPFTTADRRRGSSRTAGVTSPRSPAGSPASKRVPRSSTRRPRRASVVRALGRGHERHPGAAVLPQRSQGTARAGAGRGRRRLDPDATKRLDPGSLHMRTDHSPYASMTVTGWPALTISRGSVVARDGEPDGVRAGRGRCLARRPYLAGS